MKIEDFKNIVERFLLSKNVSTLFINGSPGSGKSFLVRYLKQVLPEEISGSEIFGPYKIVALEDLRTFLVDDLIRFGLIEDSVASEAPDNFQLFWSWLRNEIIVPKHSSIIILIDLDESKITDVSNLRVIFSSLRDLERIWHNGPAILQIILTSYWNHNSLELHYQEINLSFPYSVGFNYFNLDSISIEHVKNLLINNKCKTSDILYFANFFTEYTGGHPGLIVDIIQSLSNAPISSMGILEASKLALENGIYSNRLIDVWKHLPQGSISKLEILLNKHHVLLTSDFSDQLKVAYLIKETWVGEKCFYTIKSYYIELMLYFYQKTLGLSNLISFEQYLTERIPPMMDNNCFAYKIINELENIIRNLYITHLLRIQGQGTSHVLEGKYIHSSNGGNDDIDVYTSALDWRDRTNHSFHSPIISYLSITQLSELLKNLEIEEDCSIWGDFSDMLLRIRDIRDAVMHNQMIGDKEINDLLVIRDAIYTINTLV